MPDSAQNDLPINFHFTEFKNIDFENLQDGIQSLQFIDPRKIKKITESNKIIDKDTSKLVVNNYKEYFHYNDSATDKALSQINNPYMGMQQKTSGILTRDSIAYVPSGLTDASGKMVIGYLHKALKVANNLKMMEDSMLIYRLARAPERRIFPERRKPCPPKPDRPAAWPRR